MAGKRFRDDAEARDAALAFSVAQLRHLYTQLVVAGIIDQECVARGLLGPVIERLEKELDIRLREAL